MKKIVWVLFLYALTPAISNPQGIYQFYGTAVFGGQNSEGVLFKWNPFTSSYTNAINLSRINGGYPYGSLASYNHKLYGMTYYGGSDDLGVIFEWDSYSNTYTKKVDMSFGDGARPAFTVLTLLNNKFYGLTSVGGANTLGVIFEWDPATNLYTKKIDMTSANGANPYGSLTAFNGKLYGMACNGGTNNYGVIFEWDPSNNTYNRKISLTSSDGANPYGSLTLHNGKFYGMTYAGGLNNHGVIFEWEPSNNTYLKKIDLTDYGAAQPQGNLTYYGGKFYGMTRAGGSSGQGILFEWDPLSNIFNKKKDFTGANGLQPIGSLIVWNEKLYGVTHKGGNNNAGAIIEFDPAQNLLSTKIHFSYPTGFSPYCDLLPVEANVSDANPGSCYDLPNVTIDPSNYNRWVPITDNLGNAVAEIRANGNNLGQVVTTVYVHNGPVREDGLKRLYLDRNLTITTANAPSTPVDIRLYIKGTELDALKAAVNSNGQPSGVNSASDLAIFKNNTGCVPAITWGAEKVAATAEVWGQNGYVLKGTITSFSTFFFANSSLAALPVSLISFETFRKENTAFLKWSTAAETNNRGFTVQRSMDGNNFSPIGFVPARGDGNSTSLLSYEFTDRTPFSGRNYYRLEQADINGVKSLSRVRLLDFNKAPALKVYPNPASTLITVEIENAEDGGNLMLRMTDLNGKLLGTYTFRNRSNKFTLPLRELPAGMYRLEVYSEKMEKQVIRFIKE